MSTNNPVAGEEDRVPFNLCASSSDNPLDLLEDAHHVVSFLCLAVHADELGNTPDAVLGLSGVLRGLEETMRSIKQIVADRISDPYHKGYLEGVKRRQEEYFRGYREGRAKGESDAR